MKNALYLYFLLLIHSLTIYAADSENRCSQVMATTHQSNISIPKNEAKQEPQEIKSISQYLEQVIKNFEIQHQIKTKRHPRSTAHNNPDVIGLIEQNLERVFPPYRTSKMMLKNIKANKNAITISSIRRIISTTITSYKETLKQNINSTQAISYEFAVLETLQNLYEVTLKVEQRIELEQDQKQQSQQNSNNSNNSNNQPESKKENHEQKKGQNQSGQQGQPDQKNQQDQQGSPQDSSDENSESNNNSSKSEQKDKSEDQKPRLDEETLTEYKVRNKDLQPSSENENSEPVYGIVTSAEVQLSVLGSSIFDIIHVDGQLKKNNQLRFETNTHIPLTPVTFPKNHYIEYDNQQKAKKLVVNVPTGYQPLVGNYPNNYKVVETQFEEYSIISDNEHPLPTKVRVWLTKTPRKELTTSQISQLTLPSDIQQNQWPDHVLMGINLARQTLNQGTFSVVTKLSSWFQKQGPYLYSHRSKEHAEKFDHVQKQLLENKSIPFVLTIAEEKMFNCDGAALIGATLLRDFFKYPTRIRGGRTVSGSRKDENGHILNYVDLNDPQHAWVEVFINGQWIPFDFTPTKNAPEPASSGEDDSMDQPNDPRKKNENNDDNKNKDHDEKSKSDAKNNSEKASDSETRADSNAESETKSEADSKKDAKENKQEKSSSQPNDNSNKTSSQGSEGNGNHSSGGNKLFNDNATKITGEIVSKSHGSVQNVNPDSLTKKQDPNEKVDAKNNLKNTTEKKEKIDISEIQKSVNMDTTDEFMTLPKNYDSPLGAYAQRNLYSSLQKYINQGPTDLIKTYFNELSDFTVAKEYSTKAKLQLLSILDPFFRDNDKSIHELIVEAKNSIYRNPTIAYHKIKLVAQYYQHLNSIQNLNASELQFLNNLKSILKDLERYKDPNSGQQELVDRLIKNLPGNIIKSIITEQHKNAEQIGSTDQQILFDEISTGKWAGAYQASLVNKYFNFILNADKVYRERRVQTLLRSYIREKKSEGIVLAKIQDIANFQSWIFDPEYNEDATMTMLSRLLKDEQYLVSHRQMVALPGRGSPIERKHTNIFFDISGSMQGDKAKMQASSISAIIDRALSEKDKFGKPLHTVILYPFGTKVHPGIVIETVEQAKSVILNFLNSPTNAKDGTAFQPCFDEHFEMIRKYASKEYIESGKTSRLTLKKANMILITDGDATLDIEKVKKDLQTLPDGVQTFFNLVTLGSSNANGIKQLTEIVKITNSEHSKSMITQLSDEQLHQFANEASRPQIDPTAFVFNTNDHIDNDIIQNVLNISFPRNSEQDIVEQAQQLSSQIKGIENVPVTKNSLVTTELFYLIQIFENSKLDYKEKQFILAKVLSNYPRWTGHALHSLSLLEEKALLKLNYLATLKN